MNLHNSKYCVLIALLISGMVFAACGGGSGGADSESDVRSAAEGVSEEVLDEIGYAHDEHADHSLTLKLSDAESEIDLEYDRCEEERDWDRTCMENIDNVHFSFYYLLDPENVTERRREHAGTSKRVKNPLLEPRLSMETVVDQPVHHVTRREIMTRPELSDLKRMREFFVENDGVGPENRFRLLKNPFLEFNLSLISLQQHIADENKALTRTHSVLSVLRTDHSYPHIGSTTRYELDVESSLDVKSDQFKRLKEKLVKEIIKRNHDVISGYSPDGHIMGGPPQLD